MNETYEIQGREVSIPARVLDASSGTAVFLVPTEVAREILPGAAFEIVEVAPGQTQLVLGFVDYRKNDLGDYNEAMIVFFVRPKGDGGAPEGTFIYKLPVDQSFTCDAGREIWGFPKTIERIEITYEDDFARGALYMDGKHVFTLTLPRSPEGDDNGDIELTTYTYTPGPTATQFTQGGRTYMADGNAVEVVLGDHPVADELRALGLPATPMIATWTETMHGSFGAPRRLGNG